MFGDVFVLKEEDIIILSSKILFPTLWQNNEFLCSILEDEIRVGQVGVEHAEGELVTVPLAVELLGVLEQVDEGVDELWRIVGIGHHGIGFYFTQIAIPEKLENY